MMNKLHPPASPAPLRDFMTKKVLLLIDWDNFFLSLYDSFGPDKMQIDYRLQALLQWISQNIGELAGGYGFVFAPEHLTLSFQQMCVQNQLRLVTCPKRPLADPKRNLKTGYMMQEEDTVDETLIWFGKMMMRHPDVKFICLVAGDDDYVELFEEASHYNVRRVLAPPTLKSLSLSQGLVSLADKHPLTHKKMILRLDEL